MSLQIHRAERADRLVDALADLLGDPLGDPFVSEIVAVPTQGVERWLAQRLSHRLGCTPGAGDGICAGIAFPSVRRLTADALGYGDGTDGRDEVDPWRPDRAVWPLLAVIDEARGEAWAALLWHYLAGPDSADGSATSGRRWRTARRLADLFARYAMDRPEMIRHWAAGRDLGATDEPLAADRRWQAELWRRLRDRLGVASPPDRLTAALAGLAVDPAKAALPDRLSIFGVTRLDADHRDVIGALAEHRDVHLWLPHASPALWDAIATDLHRRPVRLGPRAADPTVGLVRHRLLSYLGRDSRELQLALYTGTVAVDRHYPSAASDGDREPALLQQLQADLTADTAPNAEPPPLRTDDKSVQIHSCHGPDRQVEVLREVLVGLLADDPTLEPRDMVVMCPDIERFAPLISAAFGLDTDEVRAEHPGHRLRVRLADRALRQLNPLLSVLSRVLDLADARMTASDVLDLAAYTPVARKFGFSEDDTERLRQLVRQSGVRWGLDGAHRAGYGMEAFGQNTWAAGLDRLLLGVAMDESGDHFIGTALPLDDVDSSDVDLIGRLAELVRRLERFGDQATAPHAVPDWVRLGREVIDGLTSTTTAESWQVNHAYAELARLTEAVRADATDDVTLTLAEVRALLADTFRGRPSRANFRTGTLTMCTMHPMRSVPHRVVCLLGVDDGVFPRRPAPNGDNLLESGEWVGDRDPRSEDRQLLLDAVMAAEEHLVVIYGGADARTGAIRPPAVPIGALLDALDQTAASPDHRRVRDHLTRRHPLQPFDPTNFTVRPLDKTAGEPFSFDRAGLRGAIVAARPREAAPTSTGLGGLPAIEAPGIIDLTELVRFFAHPARALLRTRGIWLGGTAEDDGAADELAVDLDGLTSWAIGERLLERNLRGSDLDQLRSAEWRRGSLPPQAFGHAALNQVLTGVGEIGDGARPFLTGDPVSRDVRVPADGEWVAGTLQPLYLAPDQPDLGTLVSVSYSRLGPKQRLASWLRLLALSAGCPEQRWRVVTIGRGARSILGPAEPEWAARVLADLVQIYRTGRGEPVPFAPRTSAEYALVRSRDQSVENLRPKIERVWKQERDETWEVFLGPEPALDVLLAEASRPAEERGTLVEPSRFGTLARRVFAPLFRSEDLVLT